MTNALSKEEVIAILADETYALHRSYKILYDIIWNQLNRLLDEYRDKIMDEG